MDHRHHLIRLRVAIVLAILLGAPPSDRRRASAEDSLPTVPRRIALVGDESILWLYRPEVGDDGLQLVRFAYQPTRGTLKGRFWAGPVVTGYVACAVVKEADIHVFFGDGAHHRFSPLRLGSTNTTWPAARESSLPGGALPLVLGSDPSGEILYALVSARTAEQLEVERVRRIEIERLLDDDDDDLDQGMPEVSPSQKGHPSSKGQDQVAADHEAARNGGGVKARDASAMTTELVIIRHQRGRWWVDRPGPVDVRVDGRPAVLLAASGLIHLAIADQTNLSVWTSTSTEEPFVLSQTKDLTSAPSFLTGAFCGDAVCLVAVEPADENHDQIVVERWLPETPKAWSPTLRLTDANGVPVRFTQPNAVAVTGQVIAVATQDESNTPQVGQWSIETGKPESETAVVSVLAVSPKPAVPPAAWQFLQYVLLTVILVVVFAWRRERVVAFAPLARGQRPARLERRVLAFLIDVAILSPIWVPVVFVMWRSGAPNLSVAEQLAHPPSEASPSVFWARAMVGAVVGLYAGVLESLLGQTLGKRMTRCEIVGEGGERCGIRAIFLRNALRVIEFHFPPLVVLAVLTPSRQRLGDMLARTVVIERVNGFPAMSDRTPGGDVDQKDRGD